MPDQERNQFVAANSRCLPRFSASLKISIRTQETANASESAVIMQANRWFQQDQTAVYSTMYETAWTRLKTLPNVLLYRLPRRRE